MVIFSRRRGSTKAGKAMIVENSSVREMTSPHQLLQTAAYTLSMQWKTTSGKSGQTFRCV